MSQKVLVGMTALCCLLLFAVTAAGAQAPAQWLPVDSLVIGATAVRVEQAPAKRVRVTLTDASKMLISADMPASALQRWTESVLVGLALGGARPFEFENTLAVQ